MRYRFKCACLLMLGVPAAVFAQASGSDTAELIQELLTRIDQLEKRVAALEGGGPAEPKLLAQSASTPAAAPQVAAPLQAEAAHAEHLPRGMDQTAPAAPSFKLAGFSDFNFSAADQRGSKSGFTEGQFVLHASSALSGRVNVFSELSFSARSDAGAGTPSATGFNAEVERVIVRFDQSDYFKVSFGRFHTPVNWWNTTFHHGQWLQTTVSRPEMTQFGGRFIPVHFVGGLVEGAMPAGGLNLNYNFGLGNGRGSVISRAGDAGDINNNRAWVVNLFVKPDRLFGLQTGGSVYKDKIAVAGRAFDEWITAGHVVWQKENPEFIAEFANINHSELGRSGSYNSQAYYIQVGYRLPWAERLWKPYYRFEYIHIPVGDVAFTGVPDLAASVVGMRYDITSFAAIKAEYRNQRRAPGVPRINGGFLQTSFTF